LRFAQKHQKIADQAIFLPCKLHGTKASQKLRFTAAHKSWFFGKFTAGEQVPKKPTSATGC
jgi:hypothetical protein